MSFKSDLDAAFKPFVNYVEGEVTSGTRKALGFINEASPQLTGMYKRNHRVILNNEDVTVEPPENTNDDETVFQKRTEEPIGLETPELLSRESGKLKAFRLGDIIAVANGVTYADDVEFGTATRPNGGQYAGAARLLEDIGRTK
jgi:hypothetical protein